MYRLITLLCLLLAVAAGASAQNTSATDGVVVKTYDKHYQKPMFTGGPDSLKVYIRKNLGYPEAAIENNIEGRVIVRFMVNEDGTLSHISVNRSLEAGCDNDVVRMVRAMPPWLPATYRKRPVKAVETLPVVFKLE